MICGFCKKDKDRSQFGSPPDPNYTDRGWWCRKCEANRQMIYKHGITNEQKKAIAAYQCGCAICGHWDPGLKGWTLDHDRSCCSGNRSCAKCRRGVLCGWCNKLLGLAFDRRHILRAAIEYLDAHAPGTCVWHRPVACSPRLCGNPVAA